MKLPTSLTILGIETSCDETAAAVVSGGVKVLSNIIATSLKDHQRFGGIIPEIASRRQIEYIQWVAGEALSQAKMTLKDIDAIAVTRAPGLIGSLLVGLCFARGLSRATGKPLIEIDHIKAHIYANYLKLSKDAEAAALNRLPAIGLVVSGGHSSLFYVKDFENFKLLGVTRDDAAGEAFDKVARILGLGYPGGPVIDRLAAGGINEEIKFPQAPLAGSYDFSFSGTKTAVLYYSQKNKDTPDYSVAKVAYAFQKSVVDVLVEKSLKACRKLKVNTLLVGGGVAANSALRASLKARAASAGVDVFFPPMVLCLDNAAMIAGLAFHWYN
jgi:N6-L-threonylcarbamoyladenine synthase